MTSLRTAPVIVAAIAAISASAHAEQLARWDASLGGLPQDSLCWEYAATAGVPAPVNNGEAVVLGPTTSAATASWRQALVPFAFTAGASVSARVKVNSSSYYAVNPYRRSGYYLRLSDKTGRWAQLGISGDRLLLHTSDANWTDQTYLVNTTGAFHEYTLTFSGTTVTAAIDGVVVLTDTSGTGDTPNRVMIGDLSGLAASSTETAWFAVDGVSDCPKGDLDCSGQVDGADLGLLLSAWQSHACAADLNFDGKVDGADLGILLANWG
ncbi:MAG: hypothetical protein U0625_04920 [Phycisphaerales bacterium]